MLKPLILDHPRVRRLASCPICSEPKSPGCVWCWGCHNEIQASDLKARTAAENQLDAAENRLIREEATAAIADPKHVRLRNHDRCASCWEPKRSGLLLCSDCTPRLKGSPTEQAALNDYLDRAEEMLRRHEERTAAA
jgi:hypothetical protein